MAKGKKNFHGRLLCGAAAIALLSWTSAQAQDARFDIAPQPLDTALREFGVQSGVTIMADAHDTLSKQSPGFSATADPETALKQLLAGTGLSYRRSGDVFVVSDASDPQSGSAAGDGAEGTVQALIVTAQKREENIQDVPIAMSAFTQEDLTRSQVAGGPDLMTQVPNFTFTKTNFSSYSIQIRGIGTQAISATVDPAVAVAFNNTPFIRNRFFEQEFYDLQRVEVLRGPQGTLYGRNATAGVVNIISAKPSFHYEARLSGDLGNYNSQRFEGMVNVPLVEDKVALRLAGAWTKRDGYDTNQITGNRIDGRDLWSTRLSLRFAPTDKIDVNLIWEHFREDDDRLRSGKQLCRKDEPTAIGGVTIPYGSSPPGNNNGMLYEQFFSQGCAPASLYSPDSFQTPNGLRLPYYRELRQLFVPVIDVVPGSGPFDPYASRTQSRDLRVIESTVDPHYAAETDTVELQFSIDLTNQLKLTSETGYLSDTLFSTQDYNRFNTAPHAFRTDTDLARAGILNDKGEFCDPQIGCADRLVAVDLSTADSHHFSQEFRVASDYEGPFNFSLGANFLRYDTEDKYYVFINTLSMTAAISAFGWLRTPVPEYVPGVSDTHECLRQGLVPPNTSGLLPVDGCIYMDPNPIGSLNDLGHNYFLSRNPYKLISYAVFGEAYYNIAENLKLTAGLRWTVDKKEAPRIPSWVLGGDAVGYPVAEVINQEWREPTGRLTLDWKPNLAFTDETLLYASYAHGYKAGGANPPANGLVMYSIDSSKVDWANLAEQQQAVAPKTFNPEFVDAFEAGSKNTLLGGKLTLNTAAFYYDYTGYQISQIVNRSAINLNFDAKVWGLEIEADWRPVENLRLGFKGGYEKTRMADGSRAVDMMDRTAGHSDWYVTGPFPTLPSNCILPTYTVVHPNGDLAVLGAASGGGLGPCENAYVLGLDPITNQTYQSNPPQPNDVPGGYWYQGYPGFDPLAGTPGDPYTGQNTYQGHDYGPVPNGGAGFYKNLSGHELPNAPHFTATLTADYTLPLPSDWLMTLHSDLYYQSEAWTRVFNTPGYDKLKAYTNVNLAAIFSNEDAGWKVMAYVKNVFNRDSITGAFLNSDDTGLTTNVFLTEPRLYGLRVTKEWNGGPWWTGANPNHTGPYPLTVELGGQVQRTDAASDPAKPAFVNAFTGVTDPSSLFNRDLDWGDGREVQFIYRPQGSPWRVSASFRFGKTNGGDGRFHGDVQVADKCFFGPPLPYSPFCNPTSGFARYKAWDHADASVFNRESYEVADFSVGREIGFGTLNGSLRYADLKSKTGFKMLGVNAWNIPDQWSFVKYSQHHEYNADIVAQREFKGAGPTVSWTDATHLVGNDEIGRVDLDWTISGGVLFGKQKNSVGGKATDTYFDQSFKYQNFGTITPVALPPDRSKSATVPVMDLSLGLSYEIQRMKVGAGYRWERYFNAVDGGFADHKPYDRTVDGPYFKIAVGFGG